MKKKLLIVLLGISIVFAVLAIFASMQVRATPDERARPLPGDDLIPQPIGSVNHAITIRRPRHDVWPWLAQMGSDRAGWYPDEDLASIIVYLRSLPPVRRQLPTTDLIFPVKYLIRSVPRPLDAPVPESRALAQGDQEKTRP